jgi:hypothetical protein
MKKILGSFIILLFLLACRHQKNKNEAPKDNGKPGYKTIIKPPSFFSDTLKIDSKAAVFYYPDSNQLETIKAGLDTSIYEAVMHEYYYQLSFAHTVLNNYWPKLKIVEAKTVRYLIFIKADKSMKVIDLDTKYDPYGLFVFDPEKDPSLLDMTNAESQIGFYFADIAKPGAAN